MMKRISTGLLLTMVLLLFMLENRLVGQNWPMINFDKERTSWAADETVLYPPLQIKKEIPVKSTGDYISLNYLTYYDNLLALGVGRNPNILEAVDVATGDTLWTFEIPESAGAMGFVCAQNDSMIFAGGQQGLGLYALERETGEQKWFKAIGTLYTKSIVLDSARAYILGDSLYCLSIQDGSTIWTQEMNVQSIPVVDDQYVYVVGRYLVRIFDKLTGEPVWSRTISEWTTAGAAVDNDCFYTMSNDTIFAYNKGSWDVKWIYKSVGDTIIFGDQNTIAISDNKLCFTMVGDNEGNITTLNKETGGFLWAHTFDATYMFSPTIANGVVYIIPFPVTALHGYDIENGTQVFYDDSFGYLYQPIVANHQLFVATRYSVKVFGNGQTGVDDSQDPDRHPYELMQNYPNPFNGMTAIEFILPRSEHVNLKVYNSLGEEMVTLVNEERASGLHHIDFDGTHFPGGLYFYTITAGSFVSTKQLLLIK
jgi:outer membrane protein assembly factor BamB